MVGVRGNDPHALDFSPWNLRSCLDDLIWQLGGDVAQTADDASPARRSGRSASQRSFPSVLIEKFLSFWHNGVCV